MPVVTVASREHPRLRELLLAVADAVAGELGLGAGQVIALATPAPLSVASGDAASAAEASDPRPSGGWAVVTVHGSDRGEPATTRACDAAARAAADWSRSAGVEFEGVWCEWQRPR